MSKRKAPARSPILTLEDWLLGRPKADRYLLHGYFTHLTSTDDTSDNRNRARSAEEWATLLAKVSDGSYRRSNG